MRRRGRTETGLHGRAWIVPAIAWAVVACATTGDLEDFKREAKASDASVLRRLELTQRQMAETERQIAADLKADDATISAMSRTLGEQQARIADWEARYSVALQENAELRASVAAIQRAMREFLLAEEGRYVEGLRWVRAASREIGEFAELAPNGSGGPETALAVSARPVVATRVVTVTAHPPIVDRGSQVELRLSYTIAEEIPGSTREVIEHYVILRDGTHVAAFEERAERGSGLHTSSRVVEVPTDAAPGVYTFDATIDAAGERDDGSASFEVR